MPPIDKPPMSPAVQAQMGPPGGPNFGPGIGQAQQQMEKSPAEVAFSTVEKILTGVQDEKFAPYVKKALATLQIGVAMSKQSGPESSGMGGPPKGPMLGGQPPVPLPPMPGQMPG